VRLLTITCALAMATSGAAFAATVHFEARLSGRAEAPAIHSPAVGELQADLDTDTRLLTYKLTYQSLSGRATNASFNGPAKSGKTAAAIVTVSDVSNPISGEATLTDAQTSDLTKGLWYVNISTAANPDGEIRGQVKLHVEQPDTPPAQVDWQQTPRQMHQLAR
jgi:hypothetical protein